MSRQKAEEVWMTSSEVLLATGGTWCNNGAVCPDDFRGVSTDSRHIKKGDLFLALCGQRFDGHLHLQEAMEKGASAALVERPTP